jgi:hypothetical protein
MAGFFQNLLGEDVLGGFVGGLFGNDYLRDFQHASRVFRTNGYAYSPKFKFLFHVYFEINTDLIGLKAQFPQDAHFGLAVKSISLPGYSFSTSTHNQYNRKRIVQTKINYDDVNITFHDDNANLIRNLWYAYYTYYYKDATKRASDPNTSAYNQRSATDPSFVDEYATSYKVYDYNRRNIYDPSLMQDTDWGYIGESNLDQQTALGVTLGASKAPFFKSIEIYGFNQHSFSQYKLINPMITSFKHDTYDYSQANGTMQHSMTLAYETVKYSEGAIDGNAIISGGTSRTANASARDFGQDYYDTTVSPISRPGANSTILGQGGLIDAVGGFSKDLQSGNLLGAITTAGRTYNTFKNGNLKTAAQNDIKSTIYNAAAGTPNRNTPFSFPGNKVSPFQ